MDENELVQLSVEEAVQLGAQDLTVFGHIFFPKAFRQPSPPFHVDIGRKLYAPVRQNLFLVFRDGAKTTLLRAFTAQRIAYAISRTIMYVSVSQQHAIQSIRWLKKAVESNPKFTSTFGLQPGSKWTEEWISIINTVAGVEVNVMAAGITGQIRGFNIDDFRPDLIVADDILTEENTATPAQRKKTEELFYGGLVNSLQAESEAPYAKIVLLQTPFHADDLAMKALQDPTWNPTVYGILDENGNSRWPDKFPTEKIALEMQNAELLGRKRFWMREKLCKIVKGNEVCLNTELLKYRESLPDRLIKFISIDPASSDKEKADDNVVMAIGVSSSDVYVLGYHCAKGVTPDVCVAQFFDLVMKFPPILRAGVESIAYQRTLKYIIEQEMRTRRIFIPVEMILDRRSKADRILQQIPGLLAYGHLHVHPSMRKLIDQMDEYDPTVRNQPDDLLDALAMAIRLAGPLLHSPYVIDGMITELNEDEYPELITYGGAP